MLRRREEAEYDVIEGENYEVVAINRFRSSWYDLHLFVSFWRVIETTSSARLHEDARGFRIYTQMCRNHSTHARSHDLATRADFKREDVLAEYLGR